MDLNKAMQSALRAISEKQPGVQKIYKLQRGLEKLGKLHLFHPNFISRDLKVKCRDSVPTVRMFYPKGSWAGRHVILFFHGGGWVVGDIDSYTKVCTAICRATGCRVAAVDYRLAPEHPFPAGLNDCYEISRYFYKNSWFLFSIPPEKLVIMGDSAGGNLTAAVSLKARDTGDFCVKNQILIYPAVHYDHTENSPYESVRTNGKDYLLTSERVSEYINLYANGCDRTNPYFAPIMAEDFSNMPRTLIITAELDPLRDEGEAYGKKINDAGGIAEVFRINKAIHGFFAMSLTVRQTEAAYNIVYRFLNKNEVTD